MQALFCAPRFCRSERAAIRLARDADAAVCQAGRHREQSSVDRPLLQKYGDVLFCRSTLDQNATEVCTYRVRGSPTYLPLLLSSNERVKYWWLKMFFTPTATLRSDSCGPKS